ncbi:MAG: lasso peptide biosynthesis B2 protein, partial [Brevundimonas sp.]|nr:lasso peptide biosynthesis B2 protein [Brevundimonas sp.]
IRKRRAFVAARRELALPDRPSRRATAAVAVSLLRSTLAFRGRPLFRLIEPLAPHGGSAAAPEDRLARAVAAARSAMPWIPFEGECLQRAFQLRRLLAERGMSVTWVFGVRTWPFAAHCWLQREDLVVGDTVERVSRYVPIMAV